MDNEEFGKLLHQLHDEIKNTKNIDEKDTQLLRGLDEDIRTLLERSEAELGEAGTRRLENVVYQFEATHPKLTELISRLLETLSNSGI